MSGSLVGDLELREAIIEAVAAAIAKLFEQHPGHYYYLSLITTGEAHSPVMSAWSEEALEEAVKGAKDKVGVAWGLKWSYADSPFYCFGEECFQKVSRLFSLRPDMSRLESHQSREEYECRLRAMESAMAELDKQGLFGTGKEREQIVINAEVMPPDFTNTLRALRLNPPEAIRTWLEEAAEPLP